jgi:hypothetical protein
LGLQKILGVKISVRSNSLIKVLLLLQLALSLNVFLLELGYNIIVQLHLLKALVILGIGLRCLKTILLFVGLEPADGPLQLLGLSFEALNLVDKLLELVLLSLDATELLPLFLLGSSHIFVEEVSLTSLLLDILPVLVDLLLLLIVGLRDRLQSSLDFGSVHHRVIKDDSDLS